MITTFYLPRRGYTPDINTPFVFRFIGDNGYEKGADFEEGIRSPTLLASNDHLETR